MKRHGAFRVFLDTWLARIGRVFAWVWLVFWALIGVTGLGMMFDGQPKESTDYVLPFFCLGLAALHWLLLRYIRRSGALIDDFHLYCSVLATQREKSIPDLAATLKQPESVVMNRLQTMCRRGYIHGHIDYPNKRLVFPAEKGGPDARVVACPGCGARNAVKKPGDPCRYCGAPLA